MKWLILFSLPLLSSLSLCLSPTAPDHDPSPAIDGRTGCDSRWVANCEQAGRDAQEPYLVEGLRLSTPLIIQNVSRSITVRGIDLQVPGSALVIKDSGCPTCTITIQDATIRTIRSNLTSNDTSDCGTAQTRAICVVGLRGTFRMANVTVTVPSGGVLEADQGLLMRFGGYDAIRFQRSDLVEERFERVLVQAEGGPSNGMGIYQVPEKGSARAQRFIAESLVIRDMAEGLRVEAADVRLRDSTFACAPLDESSGILIASTSFWASNVAISDCGDVGAVVRSATADVDGLKVTRSQSGALFGNTTRLRLANSTFADNGFYGLRLGAGSADIRHTFFARNGKNQSSCPTDGSVAGFVALSSVRATIRDSSFESNQCYAALSWTAASGELVDARENWWGDSNGPLLCPKSLPSVSSRCVSEDVQFFPFKTQP